MDLNEVTKVLKLSKNLSDEVKCKLEYFLKKNIDVFEWKHSNMVRISPDFMCHRLNIDNNDKLVS